MKMPSTSTKQLRYGMVILATGVMLGWLGRGCRDGTRTNTITLESERPQQRRSATSSTTPGTSRAQAAAQWLAKGGSETNLLANMKELEVDEIGLFLEALMAQIGPDGVPLNHRGELKELIGKWGEADFDAAWAWALTCGNSGWGSSAKIALLEKLVLRDPKKALALEIEELRADPQHISSVIPQLMDAKAQEGAKALLDFIDSLPKRTLTASLGGAEYPEGFDFAILMDGLAIYSANGEGQRPPYVPGSPLDIWAAQDPEAAGKWWLEHQSSEIAEWSRVLDGVFRKLGVDEGSQWAAEQFSQADAGAQGRMMEKITFGGGPEAGTRANAILSHLNDPAAREALAVAFIGNQGLGLGGGIEYAGMLSEVGGKERRIEVLQNLAQKGGFIPEAERIPAWVLEQWELSRDEVSSALQSR